MEPQGPFGMTIFPNSVANFTEPTQPESVVNGRQRYHTLTRNIQQIYTQE